MQNNVNSNISWYEGHTITSLGKILKFSNLYVQNIWQVVRWWHHQLTHLHIHIDWSRNVLWKFAKLQSVITSLFFNRFSSGFHCYVWKFLLFSSEIKLNLLWSFSLIRSHNGYVVLIRIHIPSLSFKMWPNIYRLGDVHQVFLKFLRVLAIFLFHYESKRFSKTGFWLNMAGFGSVYLMNTALAQIIVSPS